MKYVCSNVLSVISFNRLILVKIVMNRINKFANVKTGGLRQICFDPTLLIDTAVLPFIYRHRFCALFGRRDSVRFSLSMLK